MTHFGKAVALVGVVVLATLAVLIVDLRGEIAGLRRDSDRSRDRLEQLAAEISRFRLEQRAGGRGPQALFDMIELYGPELASARVAKPDYAMAQRQMDDILRAFETLGADAIPPLLARIDELGNEKNGPFKNFDQLKWLLRASVHADRDAGSELVAAVLRGQKLPNPRLRWWAADILNEMNRPLAQTTLRHILLTESSRGVDPNRAVGAGVLDPAAVATTGFSNFVGKYLDSEDPRIEDTLLTALARTESDAVTQQEIIEELGRRRSARAAPMIEKIYRDPPGAQLNPLLLNKCLDAIVSIRGEDARPFLEAALTEAPTELVGAHIQRLLAEQPMGRTAAATIPPATEPDRDRDSDQGASGR